MTIESKDFSEATFQRLIAHCSNGEVEDLQNLLTEPSGETTALSSRQVPHNLITTSRPVIQTLLSTSCGAGKPEITSCILHFAQDHNLNLESFIKRDTIVAAIEGPAPLATFSALVPSFPPVVNLDLGLIGDPLGYALQKHQYDLVDYLLAHGADPNARRCEHTAHGYHLRQAAARSPVGTVDALLKAGAKIERSGAMLVAAEKGRVDILERLIEGGADVNEILDVDVGFLGQRSDQKTKDRAQETPLHAALRHGHGEAVTLLRMHGAV